MCGIAGYFLTDPNMISPQSLWRLSRCLITGIQSRGRDATGYAYVKSDGRTNFAKYPINASDFIKIPGHLLSAASHDNLTEMPQNMLLHARFATQGEPSNNKNNHPVYSKMSGLCIIHNGWFMNDADLKEQFSLTPDAEVDTEVYLRLIEKFYIEGDVKTIETAVKEATKCVYGNIACAMVQGGKPGTMWLWRDRGDLAMVETEFGFVFASTMSTLINALGTLSIVDLASWRRINFPPNTLIKFELNKKPRVITLQPIEWNNTPYAGEIYTTTVNGEERIRRVKKGTVTYYYGNSTPNNYHQTYFDGYDKNNRGYLQRLPAPESGDANKSAEASTSDPRPEKQKTHSVRCTCKKCNEYWDWQVRHCDESIDI